MHLTGPRNLVEIFTDGLVFGVSEDEGAFGYLEIGRALGGHALGFVLDGDPFAPPSATACKRDWSAARSVCSVFSSTDVFRSATR
jgi:hypothetical protein